MSDRDPKNEKDEWDKPSWRDRDSKNSRSPHALKDEKPQYTSSLQKRQESVAKKDLDELFKPKISKEEAKTWEEVSKTSGPGFSKIASEFVDKFGYPKDWNDQIKLLEHNDTDFVSFLLNHMKEHLELQTPTKKELFHGKLKVLLASCDDYSLSKKIQHILTTEFPD